VLAPVVEKAVVIVTVLKRDNFVFDELVKIFDVLL
jgi:hypothetical protein